MTTKQKYIVMCVGYTHSGKTTFAKELESELHATKVIIEGDVIAAFAKKNYIDVFTSDYSKSKKKISDPNLKFLLYKSIFGFSMNAGIQTIILSNGNLDNDIRNYITKSAQESDYKMITVYFNLPESTIAERIRSTTKGTDAFAYTKNWEDIKKQQDRYAELPPSKTDIYYEITDEASLKQAKQSLISLLNQ